MYIAHMRTHAYADTDLFGVKKRQKYATAVRPAFTQRLCRSESRVLGVCGMQFEPHALPSIFMHEEKQTSATRQDAIHMHQHSLLHLYPQATI